MRVSRCAASPFPEFADRPADVTISRERRGELRYAAREAAVFDFVAAPRGPAYIGAMVLHRQPVEFAHRRGVSRPLSRVVLADHARLPWRFFGRLTAAIQAGL